MKSIHETTNVIVRVLDAPRQKLWEAWSTPELFVKWWGPKGFTSPEAKIDFRVGGSYLSCMQTPAGMKIYGTGTYTEITPLEKIVFTDNFADQHGKKVPASYYGMGDDTIAENTFVTVTFEPVGNRTKLTLRAGVGLPGAQKEEEDAWNEMFDKLTKVVGEVPPVS
jgi:uncharacterized protein YndB with AHSA1/START domain